MTTPDNTAFSAILNQAADVDRQADEVTNGPAPEKLEITEIIDPVDAWAEIPAMVGSLLSMAAPELREVYKPETCRAWGESMHRLAVKRQWAVDGLPPEVSAALASAMFVIPTVAVFKARAAQAKAARVAQYGTGETQGNTDATAGA